VPPWGWRHHLGSTSTGNTSGEATIPPGNNQLEATRTHKISEQTIYVWRRRFGKRDPADVKRLRELETENAKLKRMVAEREMAIETLKEINRRKW